MTKFLSEEEFLDEFGFDEVEDFEALYKRAEQAIYAYTNGFYDGISFDGDYDVRKRLIKQALASQIAYLNESGILSAENRQHYSTVRIGRTTVSAGGGGFSPSNRLNLSIDAEEALKRAGFGYRGVTYDR